MYDIITTIGQTQDRDIVIIYLYHRKVVIIVLVSVSEFASIRWLNSSNDDVDDAKSYNNVDIDIQTDVLE